MRSFAVSVLVLGLANSLAVAGAVTFSPSSQDVNAGDIVNIDVTLSISVSDLNGAQLILGSNDVAFDWSYSADWTGAMANLTGPLTIADIGVPNMYAGGGFFLGGSNPDAGIGSSSILLGTISVDTTGLAERTYTFEVNRAIDGNTSKVFLGLANSTLIEEPLAGSGSFSVVPEPATLALLGIGGLAAAMRRRRRA